MTVTVTVSSYLRCRQGTGLGRAPGIHGSLGSHERKELVQVFRHVLKVDFRVVAKIRLVKIQPLDLLQPLHLLVLDHRLLVDAPELFHPFGMVGGFTQRHRHLSPLRLEEMVELLHLVVVEGHLLRPHPTKGVDEGFGHRLLQVPQRGAVVDVKHVFELDKQRPVFLLGHHSRLHLLFVVFPGDE